MGIRDTVWAKQLVLRPSRIAKEFGTQHLVSRWGPGLFPSGAICFFS